MNEATRVVRTWGDDDPTGLSTVTVQLQLRSDGTHQVMESALKNRLVITRSNKEHISGFIFKGLHVASYAKVVISL